MGGLEQPGNSISQSQGLEPKIHACRDRGCMHNTHGTSSLRFLESSGSSRVLTTLPCTGPLVSTCSRWTTSTSMWGPLGQRSYLCSRATRIPKIAPQKERLATGQSPWKGHPACHICKPIYSHPFWEKSCWLTRTCPTSLQRT